MMNRTQKAEVISGLSGRLERSAAAFLVDFKGMNVEQVTDFRKKLFETESEMRVVRNTLAKRALAAFPEMETALSEEFTGTNAFVFAYGDVGASAKAVVDFADGVDHLEIKAGVMEGSKLDEAAIKYLGNLPSKDVLRAQLLGTLAAPASQFVRTLSAVPSGFVRVLAAYQDQK